MADSPVAVRARERVRSIDALDCAIGKLSRELDAGTYRLLLLVREFDERFGWAKWSFPSCAEWLAWRSGLSLSAARERVRTAHALRALPAISKAFSRGQLSYSKVRELTRVANRQNDELLAAYARKATTPQVEARCRQLRNVAADSVDVARRAFERRSLTMLRQGETGTMRITLEVPIEDGELFAKAIDLAVAAGEADLGPEFDTNGAKDPNNASGWQAEQADAAIAIARAYLGADPGTRQGAPAAKRASTADHYQVVVHVDAAALNGRDSHRDGAKSLNGGISHHDGAESLNGGLARSDLPIETVRRLSCDGSLVHVTEDVRGNPLDVGRKRRTVPAAIKRALYARDRYCAFPGCHRTHYLDAHHIRHWSVGGETRLDNLILLCTQHHRLLHEGGFAIERDGDDDLRFERPDGRVIPRCGYRREDYVDDGIDEDHGDEIRPSREVREPAGYYRISSTRHRASRPCHKAPVPRRPDRISA